MRFLQSTLLAVLFLAANVLTAQENISLNLKKGETYTLNQTSISTMDQVVSGMPIKSKTTVIVETNFTVTGMNGENYLIEIVPTKMSTKQVTDMGEMSMDSEGDDSDPMNVIMKNLVNRPMTMELSPKGEISNFNSAGYLDDIMKGIDMPDMAKIQLGAQMAEQYNDQALMDSYKYYFSLYPNTKVAVGDTWKSEYTADVMVPINTQLTNELTSIDADNYTINSTAQLSTNGSQESKVMGMSAVADLKGSMKTTYVLNKKTGWITTMQQEQNIDGEMTILKSAQMPEEMKMTMKVNNATSISPN